MRFYNINWELPEPVIPVGPASNEIWYTSISGEILLPTSVSALPLIVSNTYTDGKGVMTFASNLTSIGDWAFNCCQDLESIRLPNSVTTIGVWALGDAKSLTSVILGNNVTHLYTSAFYGSNNIATLELGNSIQYIGENALRELYALTTLNLPGTISYIGPEAFYGNNYMTTLNYNNTMAAWNAISKDPTWKSNFYLSVVHCTDGDVAI